MIFGNFLCPWRGGIYALGGLAVMHGIDVYSCHCGYNVGFGFVGLQFRQLIKDMAMSEYNQGSRFLGLAWLLGQDCWY